MVFGVIAVVLAMIFLIQCIREVNTEESELNAQNTESVVKSTPELKYQRFNQVQ